MKLSRVQLTFGVLHVAAVVACLLIMSIPSIASAFFHVDTGHDMFWSLLGAGLYWPVWATLLILQKQKPGHAGKGLLVLGAATGWGITFILLGLCDFFPTLPALVPGGSKVVVALSVFFSAIFVVGFVLLPKREAESTDRTDGQKQDGIGEEPDRKGATHMDE